MTRACILFLADLAQFSYFGREGWKDIAIYQQFERGQRLLAVKNLVAIRTQC